MKEFTVLIGGPNGYGINEACMILCRLFSRMGYHVFGYNDFPSVIKGQHQFAVVRASSQKVTVHKRKPDIVLAMDQETLDRHRPDFLPETMILYDADRATVDDAGPTAVGISLSQKIKAGGGDMEMGPSLMVAALAKQLGIPWDLIEDVVQKHHPGKAGMELELMGQLYDQTDRKLSLDVKAGGAEGVTTPLSEPLPVLNGCQAISLGLLQAGLKAYTAYPMTPTSPILEYFAALEKEAGLQVVLPESEIAVILTSLGYSYMGVKNAIATSGGGFSLMVEGLGLSGMSELPVLVIMGQRAGPSTGMPTYTAQTDLMFTLSAGHGEFPRFVVAPGDAEEAYYWAGIGLNKAWKYRMPAIVLIDKALGLGIFSFDKKESEALVEESAVDPRDVPGSVSGQVIKANSYVHDKMGYARENPEIAKASADHLLQKEKLLAEDLEQYEQVKVYGEGDIGLLCWGSSKGACVEVAAKLGLKAIQVLVLAPFPTKAVTRAMEGVGRVITVECNAKGQLAMLMAQNGFPVDDRILKYDGRPFALEELEEEVKKVMK